jgi:hypothetical protein
MLAMRSWFGANYLASPTPLPAKAGFASSELTPSARFFAAVFAAREFLLVAMVLRAAAVDRAALWEALIGSAAVDAFDATSATVLALSGTRSRRGAVTSAVTAAISAGLGGLAARRV